MSEPILENEINQDALGSFQVDEKSGVPIWIQIRKRLIYLINSGKYEQGKRLPSVREMSVRLGVNYNTINKVYQDLERDGFIFTKRGKGTYVSDLDSINYIADGKEIEALAVDFVQNALGAGMGIEDIVDLVKDQVYKLEGSRKD